MPMPFTFPASCLKLKNVFSRWILPVLFFTITFSVTAQQYQPNWESLDKRPMPTWYTDAKFGIFIHWGVYSVPAWSPKGQYSEWYQHWLESKSFNGAVADYHQKVFGNDTYYQLAPLFKAELYNPDEWAKLIEASGAKYVVLTSKHHDGFALWPSKEASRERNFAWNAQEVGPKRDVLGDLFTALRKTSVKPGMYYSLYEWYNPMWLSNKDKYITEHMWPQMKELVNNYKPYVFWTDGEWDLPSSRWKAPEFLSWMFSESPVKNDIVVNDRWGSDTRFHHGGIYTPEYQPDLDFEDHPWEESRGMGFSYGYNREEDAWDYNSTQSLLISLIDKVSRGGNFLLDIGPDAHGKIPPIMQDRLLEMGKWININSEAIYGTRRWKTPSQWTEGRRDYSPKNADWKTGSDLMLKLTVDPEPGYAAKESFFSYNPATNNLYAILPLWPKQRKFTWKNITLTPGTIVELLETKTTLQWQQDGDNVIIQFPEYDPSVIKSRYAYTVKVHNTGAFVKKPTLSVKYAKGALNPVFEVSNIEPGAIVHYTLDGSDPSMTSPIYNGTALKINETAVIKVSAFKDGLLPSGIAEANAEVYSWQKAVTSNAKAGGLKYYYYPLTGSPATVNILAGIQPTAEGHSGIDLSSTKEKQNFGLKMEGYIRIAADGIYSFHLQSDDGSVLWMDDKLFIDYDGTHGDEPKSRTVALKKGLHKIKLLYFQASGGIALKLSYNTNGEKPVDVTKDILLHD
ncbi:MAG: alpha-L-fucosidase [Agriterribacter sp.]